MEIEPVSDKIPALSPSVEICSFNADEYLVHHKDLGHNININRNTYLVLQLVDGEKTIADIRDKLQSLHNCFLSPSFIDDLLFDKLGKFGIILQQDSIIKQKMKPNYLRLSFTLIPHNVLRLITPLFAMLFVKWIYYPLMAGLVLLISLVITLDYPVIKYWFDYKNLSFLDFGIYFIMYQFGNLFHEIGHASALKYFGKESGGIGAGFYIFTPALFTDVSEAWKLKRKERIIINTAGVYFELLIAGILLLLYTITNDTLLLLLPCLMILNTLVNLNPFLKLDGYWILSDATNTPNLSKKSKEILTQKVQQIKKLKIQFNSLREGLLFLYSLLSILFVLVFLTFVLINDPYSIIRFPLYIVDLFVRFQFVNILIAMKMIFIPLIFWYLLFSALRQYYNVRNSRIIKRR